MRYDEEREGDRLTQVETGQQYQMAGKLTEHPLAELIHELSIANLSGALRLEHERVKAAIYFEEGNTVFAAANVRDLRLYEYLRKQNLVSEKQLAAIGNSRSDTSLATALSDKGVLDRLAIESIFAALVADILRLTLSWKEGTWEYDQQARLADTIRVKIDTSSLLVESAREFEPTFVANRFPNPDEVISPVAEQPQSARLLPIEGFVLSRLEQPRTVNELVILSGLGHDDALRTIYGLVLAGCLQRQNFPQVLKRSATSKKPVAPSPPPLPPPPPIVKEPEIAPGLTEEQELNLFLARMEDASNHYAVLDVARSAEIAEIKSAYYSLARRFHPDRFHAHAELHSRVESAFARVTQAYETLTHSKQKSAYDSKLAAYEKAQKFADAAPKRKEQPATGAGERQPHGSQSANAVEEAEKRYRDGYAALQMGQTGVALTNLAAAAQAIPREARYRAYYGRALAANEKSRKLAESELQAAIKLDPTNATYRMMLAELFYDLRFHRRALTEVERVLELDPSNREAQALRKKLEAS